jgi:hypothetical protein
MSSPPSKLSYQISFYKITLALLVAIAFFLRVYELPTEFLYVNSYVIYDGLRLHILDLFNLGDHAKQNFFKSVFVAPTTRHIIGSYVPSIIYSWLGIPLSEFWLRFFYVCLGTLCVVGAYLIGRQLYDYRLGLVGVQLSKLPPRTMSPNKHKKTGAKTHSKECLTNCK